jgi:N-acetylglucosamine kinase-like BadF-type ATPase
MTMFGGRGWTVTVDGSGATLAHASRKTARE